MQNASSHDLFEFEDVILILIQVDNKSKDSLFLLALCFLIHITYTLKWFFLIIAVCHWVGDGYTGYVSLRGKARGQASLATCVRPALELAGDWTQAWRN